MQNFILGTIAKNEGPFLKEWILYHKLVCGFDKIFVYNNDSTDESKNILCDLQQKGFCDWIDWPRGPYTNPPYQTFMSNFMQILKKFSGWACLMDVDEFLVLKKHQNIKELVESFPEDAGSISFNWNMMYSLSETRHKEPITNKIIYCLGPNSHVKTLARINAVKYMGMHTFNLFPGYKYLNSSGFEYKIDLDEISEKSSSLDSSICVQEPHIDCSVGQINHYRIKSKEDCIVKDENGYAASIEYVKKNSLDKYQNLKKRKNHICDFEIQEFINRVRKNFYTELLSLEIKNSRLV